jgi:hypothetical protein
MPRRTILKSSVDRNKQVILERDSISGIPMAELQSYIWSLEESIPGSPTGEFIRTSSFTDQTDLNAHLLANPDVTYILIDNSFALTDNWAIPSNMTLVADYGGQITGSYTITGDNTVIDIGTINAFGNSILFAGSFVSINGLYYDRISAGGLYTDSSNDKFYYGSATKRFSKFYSTLITDNGSTVSISNTIFSGSISGLSKSDVGLGNVANESKATMFTNPTFTGTVTGVSKSMVGLGNVDNTSDLNKPLSTATTNALALKANTSALSAYAPIVSPSFPNGITVNTLLNSTGDVYIVGYLKFLGALWWGATQITTTAAQLNYLNTATSNVQSQIDLKSPLASPTFTGTVTIPSPFTVGGVSVTTSGTRLNYLSTATSDIQTQLNAKQATLVSATNIKTINSTTLLGSGDLAVQQTLVSGSNIKTINGSTLLGSGDLIISVTEGASDRLSVKTYTTVSAINSAISTTGIKMVLIDTVFTLSGNWTIPLGVTLVQSDGGYITGAYVITGDNTQVIAEDSVLFATNVTTAGTWKATNIYATWFGAVGDGVTNDYTALTKAISFSKLCTYETLHLSPNKTYHIYPGLEWIVTNPVVLDGHNSTLHTDSDDASASDDILYIYQNATYTRSIYQITADITEGSTTVVLNTTANLVAGMGIIIFGGVYSQEDMAGHDYYKFLMTTIDSVLDDGVTIIVKDPAKFTLESAVVNTNATGDYGVSIYTTYPVTIQNLKFECENYDYNKRSTALRLKYLWNPKIYNITDTLKGYTSLSIGFIYNVLVSGLNVLPNPLKTRSGDSKTITAFSDYSGTVPGTVKVDVASHGYMTGNAVLIAASGTAYDGHYIITKIDANSFYIYDTYTSNLIPATCTGTQDNYGILPGACAGGIIEKLHIRTGTHCIAYTTPGASYGMTIQDANLKSVLSGATSLDSHGSRDVIVKNSTFHGIQVGGGYVKVVDCDIYPDYLGTQIFGERTGWLPDKSMKIDWLVLNSRIYVSSIATAYLYYGEVPDATYPTSTFVMKNCKIFNSATQLWLHNNQTADTAVCKDVVYDGNLFIGSGVLQFPYATLNSNAATSGTFIFRNNAYTQVSVGAPPMKRFNKMIIEGNYPTDYSVSDFKINTTSVYPIDLICRNNIFTGSNVYMTSKTGTQIWDNNVFYNTGTSTTTQNRLNNNSNLIFTNNKMMAGKWMIYGTTNQNNNLYTGYKIFNNTVPINYYNCSSNNTFISTGLGLLATDFSVHAKVKFNRNSSSTRQAIFGSNGTKFAVYHRMLSATDEYIRVIFRSTPSGTTYTFDYTGAYSDNNWHTVTVTFSQSTNTINTYLDGSLLGSETSANYVSLHDGGLLVGMFAQGASPAEFFYGSIASASIYTKALTVSEISKLVENDDLKTSSCVLNLGTTKTSILWTDNSTSANHFTIGADKTLVTNTF